MDVGFATLLHVLGSLHRMDHPQPGIARSPMKDIQKFAWYILVYIARCFYVVPHFEIWDYKLGGCQVSPFQMFLGKWSMLKSSNMIQLAWDYHLT